MTNQTKSPKYSPEVHERAVRMVFEHRSEHTSQCKREADPIWRDVR